jgi:hypothetical protein
MLAAIGLSLLNGSLDKTSTIIAESLGAVADDDFYGIVESRPLDGDIGAWVVGGRTFTATAATKIDTDDGPFDIGACASADTEGERVEEIESEPAQKCA